MRGKEETPARGIKKLTSTGVASEYCLERKGGREARFPEPVNVLEMGSERGKERPPGTVRQWRLNGGDGKRT